MGHNQTSFSENIYSPKSHNYTTVILANKKSQQLEGGHSTKIGGMCNIKHEIRSLKLYKFLIKIELKDDTALILNNLYNHIKLCINEVTRLQ